METRSVRALPHRTTGGPPVRTLRRRRLAVSGCRTNLGASGSSSISDLMRFSSSSLFAAHAGGIATFQHPSSRSRRA